MLNKESYSEGDKKKITAVAIFTFAGLLVTFFCDTPKVFVLRVIGLVVFIIGLIAGFVIMHSERQKSDSSSDE